MQEFELSRRCPGLVRDLWKEHLMQHVGHQDDRGDILSIYKTYAQLYCILPGKQADQDHPFALTCAKLMWCNPYHSSNRKI